MERTLIGVTTYGLGLVFATTAALAGLRWAHRPQQSAPRHQRAADYAAMRGQLCVETARWEMPAQLAPLPEAAWDQTFEVRVYQR